MRLYPGAIIGRLTIIKRTEKLPNSDWRWLCECTCGRVKEMRGVNLYVAKSCGCLKNEKSGARLRSHGRCRTREYATWSNMKARCTNPKDPFFDDYGGRGIFLCERWMKFEHFFADMGEAPPGHTLERIDNDGGYEPDNCRWATQKEQARNTRRNHYLTRPSDGKTQCMSAWAEELGISYTSLKWRVKQNWDGERLFSSPRRRPRRNK